MAHRVAHQVHAPHVCAGLFAGLLDGHRHALRLAVTQADLSLAVSDDDQCGNAERAPAFGDLVGPPQVNHLLKQS